MPRYFLLPIDVAIEQSKVNHLKNWCYECNLPLFGQSTMNSPCDCEYPQVRKLEPQLLPSPDQLREIVRNSESMYAMTTLGLSVRITKKEALAFIDRCEEEGPWDLIIEDGCFNRGVI